MNLQPIYPARVSGGQTVTVFGSCGHRAASGTGFANLDKFGEYVCIQCVTTFHMPAGRAHEMLVERDRRELEVKRVGA